MRWTKTFSYGAICIALASLALGQKSRVDEIMGTLRDAKTIAVAPVTAYSDELRNAKATDDVQKWLTEFCTGGHNKRWTCIEDAGKADLLLVFREGVVPTGATTVATWYGTSTTADTANLVAVGIADGKGEHRVLMSHTETMPAMCFGARACVKNTVKEFLADSQKKIEKYAEKAATR